jgi:hypothetical protein
VGNVYKEFIKYCEKNVIYLKSIEAAERRILAKFGPSSKVSLEDINRANCVTIIGRGHSGTRLLSKALTENGVYMGAPINHSHDLIPPNFMYKAMRLAGKYVTYKGNFEWDFSGLINQDPDDVFFYYLRRYLSSVIGYRENALYKGWKIPETTLIFPWLVRCFPEMKYIYWVRDPRDSILGKHLTDRFHFMNVPFERTEDALTARAASWKYQWDLVNAGPKPKHFLLVKYEDFILKQRQTRELIEDFLGIPLAHVEVNTDRMGLWERSSEHRDMPMLSAALKELGYAQ